MNCRNFRGLRHFVPVPRQLGTLFFLYFSQRVLFFILKYLYYYFPSHSLQFSNFTIYDLLIFRLIGDVRRVQRLLLGVLAGNFAAPSIDSDRN